MCERVDWHAWNWKIKNQTITVTIRYTYITNEPLNYWCDEVTRRSRNDLSYTPKPVSIDAQLNRIKCTNTHRIGVWDRENESTSLIIIIYLLHVHNFQLTTMMINIAYFKHTHTKMKKERQTLINPLNW